MGSPHFFSGAVPLGRGEPSKAGKLNIRYTGFDGTAFRRKPCWPAPRNPAAHGGRRRTRLGPSLSSPCVILVRARTPCRADRHDVPLSPAEWGGRVSLALEIGICRASTTAREETPFVMVRSEAVGRSRRWADLLETEGWGGIFHEQSSSLAHERPHPRT